MLDLFFNDLTADEVNGLVEIMSSLNPYEMIPGVSCPDEPYWTPAKQFVIERFIDLQQRLEAAEVEAAEKKLLAEFGPVETVIDTV